jgi:alkylation response protein AidB-like acyl-CoA dehydrogenase
MAELDDFRAEVRAWLQANCPPGARGEGEVAGGGHKVPISADLRLWLDRCAERGYTAPTWPREYGGGGLDKAQYLVLLEEMRAIRARAPLAGMGTSMIGPTLLEFGTEDQKRRHLPRITSGEVRWCQGYSEPSSGSDLASLRTRAVDHGDHFVVNGQKIWTSGAQYADWIFTLVRTNPDVPKHDGISFLLMPMDQPGIRVRPIRLISGASPFCETFYTNAIARKEDLVGGLDRGWTVGKRLLQHERSGLSSLAANRTRAVGRPLAAMARDYVGVDARGRIADPQLREQILRHNVTDHAFRLTQRRAVEEADGTRTPGFTTSIFKLYGANLGKQDAELKLLVLGSSGLGWEGAPFSDEELQATRAWLAGKAGSIAGGSNEVQSNIIAKRVLGLPD